MRLSDMIVLCRGEMAALGHPGASLEAEILVSGVTGVPRSRFFHEADRDVGDRWAALRSWIARRAAGEPVQYILGAWDFFGREFHLSRDTLIPRPETEGLVEELIGAWREKKRGEGLFLDVGTGCGAIAVTLALELAGVRVVATDVSRGALAVARRNARRHGAADRVSFVAADGYSALKTGDRFDVVVSNPPYVSEVEWSLLPREVRDFEPARALIAGPDGLSVLCRLAASARDHLKPGGELWCEIGEGQGASVGKLPCSSLLFLGVSKDLSGRDRVARWRKTG